MGPMEATLMTDPSADLASPPLKTTVLGEQIAYRCVSGPARPGIVAIHGLGSDSRDLLELVRSLHMGAVLIDLPGFGHSCRPDREFSVRRAARAVLGLLDLLGWVRPIWLGTSYGAHVALRAALDAPLRVERAVLISAGGLDPHPPAALIDYFAEERLAARTRDEVAGNLAALACRPTAASERYTARRLALHGELDAPGGNDLITVARSAQGALRDDTPRRLEKIYQPIDLLHGEGDALVSHAVASAAAERLPRGELHTLSGLGHLPWLEDPAGVASRVRRLLSTSPAPLQAAQLSL